jgi:hypothetical protein
MANVKQYLMNKLSSMLVSIIQGSKLFSTVIGDMGVLGRQIKIEARHQILHQMNLPTYMPVYNAQIKFQSSLVIAIETNNR